MSQGKWELSGKADVTDPFHVMPLQGKEEFEKTQKELLEKGNIIRQSKDQLEHQQVRALGKQVGAAVHSSWGVHSPMSCFSLTSAAGLTAALFPGCSRGAFYLAFHTSTMPVERGVGALILQRSLAQLSWGWCPSLCSLRLVAMATCAGGSMEGSRCWLNGHPHACLSPS